MTDNSGLTAGISQNISILYLLSRGRYIYTWVCNEDYYSASGILLNNKGDTSTVVCTNSQPPTTIQGGETVSIDVVVQGHYEKRMFDNLKDPGDYQDGGSMDICAIYESGGYSYFDFGGDSTTLYTSWEEPTAQRVFKCEIRNGSSEGDILNIRACAIKGAMCHYKYIWHDTSSVVSEAATESKVDSSSESDHTAETEDDSMWLNVVIDTSAPDSAGEDSGVVIDEEIVEGKRKRHKDKDDSGSKAAAAGGAALVGAAAAGATMSDKKKGKSTYKMHIYKEFGNTLEQGKQYFVYARIVEYDSNGKPTQRDDLSQKIWISSEEGVQVNPANFSSPWTAARIELYNAENKKEAVVNFGRRQLYTAYAFSDLLAEIRFRAGAFCDTRG